MEGPPNPLERATLSRTKLKQGALRSPSQDLTRSRSPYLAKAQEPHQGYQKQPGRRWRRRNHFSWASSPANQLAAAPLARARYPAPLARPRRPRLAHTPTPSSPGLVPRPAHRQARPAHRQARPRLPPGSSRPSSGPRTRPEPKAGKVSRL